ncbi:ATP-binding protein [Psychrobium sp. nBUS_13]|uniref:ATP-binding protein n=1 Tax=Psychrobium sp. nBUS_13 TaxID=3395319 RepID=UPI003EB79AAB
MPNRVLIDEARVRQVLFNLIGNAVKFTHRGKISVQVSALYIDEQLKLTFCVKDTGIGICPMEQSIIFDSFAQPKDQNIDQYGGTGLGLAISKRLVNLMGGDLEVCSVLEQGSIFSFAIRNVEVLQEAITCDKKIEDTQVIFKGQHVLVADDIEDNRLLLYRWLVEFGLHVDTVADGQSAVDAVKHKRYDLVLLDIRMPKLNG